MLGKLPDRGRPRSSCTDDENVCRVGHCRAPIYMGEGARCLAVAPSR
ncbi:hypothetical protein [Brachybacterium sacelli]